MTFLDIRFLDILDIFLVAYLMYQIFMLIRGTAAIGIFIGLFSVYLIWYIVKALNMQLLGSILGQVMGVGVIALIIVFQQEIRRFLLMLGTRYFSNDGWSVRRLLSFIVDDSQIMQVKIYSIIKACVNCSKTNTGALIVIAKSSDLGKFIETGESLNSKTSTRLLESIFFKNSPLHDGAVIIKADKIIAAACVLPVSERQNLPEHMGLRHRAAAGVSELSDAFTIIVSEETGAISYTVNGQLSEDVTATELRRVLEYHYKKAPEDEHISWKDLVKKLKLKLSAS